jgi:hypothetical protein
MTSGEAQTIGRKKTIKATIIIVAIALLIIMFLETRGDFANGILFFLQAVTNLHAIAIYIILFGTTFLFGGLAGREIILGKKNYITVAIKYSVLIILMLSIYITIMGKVTGKDMAKDLHEPLLTYFLIILSNTGIYIIPLFGCWIWATNQMRLIATKNAA